MTLSLTKSATSDQKVLADLRRHIIQTTQYIPTVKAAEDGGGPSVLDKLVSGLSKIFGASADEDEQIERVDNSAIKRRQNALGLGGNRLNYLSGLPAGGHSGEAGNVPILQFISNNYRPVFSRLGINNLADFLSAAAIPAARQDLYSATGLPPYILLMAAARAELLDLPLAAAAQKPHINDILLLSALGIFSVGQFAVLRRAVMQNPSWGEIFLELMAMVQKNNPDYRGRQRITRVEFKEWSLAAGKRGSDLMLSDADNSSDSRAEHSIAAYWQKSAQNPPELLRTAILRLHIMCKKEGLYPSDELEESMNKELIKDGYREALSAYSKITTAKESALNLSGLEHTIWHNLWPTVREQENSLILAPSPYALIATPADLPWQPLGFTPISAE